VLLHRILELKDSDDIFLAEESLQDLISLPVTSEILSTWIEADRAVDVGSGLGVALHLSQPADFWILVTDRYSENKALKEFRQQRSDLQWGIVKIDEDAFFEAIVEYFSLSLVGELFCESCNVLDVPHYMDDRIRRLESFLKPKIPREASLLEICCGSGMATQSLLRLGCRPISMELDRCELCLGIKAGKLEPGRSFILDARLLGKIFLPGSFDVVAGFMIGLIDQINWNRWREIILTASDLARCMVLFTVYTREEAELIAKALNEADWDALIIDNRDQTGIYDQWAVQSERKSRRKG